MKGNQKKIPRPLNAFMLFANDTRASFRKKYPKEKNSHISVKLGEAWKALSGQEKTRYYQLSKKAEIEHRHKYPDYTFCPNEARTKKRLRQEKRTGLQEDKSNSNSQDPRRSRSSETIAGPQRYPHAPAHQGHCAGHWPAPINNQNPWHVGQGDHVYPMQPMYGAHCAIPPPMHYHGLPFCDHRQMPMMYPHYNGMMPYMPRPQPRMMYSFPPPPPYIHMGATHQEHPDTHQAGHLPPFEAFSNPMVASANPLTIPTVVPESTEPMVPVNQEFSSDAGPSAGDSSHGSMLNEITADSKSYNMEEATSIQSHGSMFNGMTADPKIHNIEEAASMQSHGSMLNEMTAGSQGNNMNAVTSIQSLEELKMTTHPQSNTTEATAFIQNHGEMFNDRTVNPQGSNMDAATPIQSHRNSLEGITAILPGNSMGAVTSVQSHGSTLDEMTANSKGNKKEEVTSVQTHGSTLDEMTANSKGNKKEEVTSVQSHGSTLDEMTANSQGDNMNAATCTHGTFKEMTLDNHDSSMEAATSVQNNGSTFYEMTANSQVNNTVQNHHPMATFPVSQPGAQERTETKSYTTL